MTALTTIAIILALFLGAAIVIALRHHNIATQLRIKIKVQDERIKSYQEANADISAYYSVKQVCTEVPEYKKYNGYWGVCRYTSKGGCIIFTTIKVFTDEDNEFNKREAEELCDKLNEK